MSAMYEIGMIRDLFGQDLMDTLRQAMYECRNLKEPYFIYFFNQHDLIDGTVHRTTVRAMRRDQLKQVIPTAANGKLIPMLGTCLLKVDNQKGKAEWVWVLPRDIPHTQGMEACGQVIEEIAEQAWARDMPIINS